PKPQAESDVKPIAPVAAASDRETPVATSGRETADRAPAAPASLALDVQAQGPCWIEATAGGQRIVGRLMDTGNTQTIPLKDELTLRVGDPGTFAFTIGGVKGRPLGEPGKPVTVHINRDNYKTFLESK